MIFVVRPLLRKLAPAKVTETALAALLFLVLVSSWHRDPRHPRPLRRLPRRRHHAARSLAHEALIPHIRGLTNVIFLPLFFAVTVTRDWGQAFFLRCWPQGIDSAAHEVVVSQLVGSPSSRKEETKTCPTRCEPA
jgi:hypothetical protein